MADQPRTDPDPMRYWQDSDDPEWSDETEARFVTELSRRSLEHALRPRDQSDVDVHPRSFRGEVLAFYDGRDVALAQLSSTRRGRMLLWLTAHWRSR